MRTFPLTEPRLVTGIRIIARCRACDRGFPVDLDPVGRELRIYGLLDRRYDLALNTTPTQAPGRPNSPLPDTRILVELVLQDCRPVGPGECADCGYPQRDPGRGAT